MKIGQGTSGGPSMKQEAGVYPVLNIFKQVYPVLNIFKHGNHLTDI